MEWQFSTPIEIRYVETDAMQFVHHSNYPVWFELARIRFFAEHGLHYHEMEAKDWLIPVLELRVRYAQPLRFGDQPVISVRIHREGAARFRFSYAIIKDGEITCEGETLHAVMTRQGRPTRIPAELGALIDQFSTKA